MNFADWCRMISKQTAVICLKSEPEIKFQYSGHLGEFKCISSKKKLMPVCEICLVLTVTKNVPPCCRNCDLTLNFSYFTNRVRSCS